ncbi:hypothetical protein G4G27_08175 [Sphingomonas sp. So64.6b]|uniref:hypothetical protein n=1 Tax=Sphingomonas sp. So64.6b TaxID=2997354 RepID=UPI0016044949|nr:hypothetical protein [Sphingomonas sp. So64.6b]QNA83966.1 hypothetical protein G4G27_08175 [Sphingomonas sp. So64.6b]
MRRFLIICAPLTIYATMTSAAPAPSPPVEVQYHRPTDIFILLDNLPDWLPGYTASAYGADWSRQYGLSARDRRLLAAYRAFRLRTAPVARDEPASGSMTVLAAKTLRNLDPFSRPFFAGADFAQSARTAIAAQPASDRTMLRAYVARFAPRATTLLATQSRFGAQHKRLAAELADPKLAGFIAEMRAFYRVPPAPAFTARFVWWPDSGTTQAKVRGRYILLQSNPNADMQEMNWAPIVLHEFAHYLSAGMEDGVRKRLSTAYLRLCPAAASMRNPLNTLEEPLAIYWGQYRYSRTIRGRELTPDESWYNQPVADRIAKALARAFPADAPAPQLDDPRLIEVAGIACAAG